MTGSVESVGALEGIVSASELEELRERVDGGV